MKQKELRAIIYKRNEKEYVNKYIHFNKLLIPYSIGLLKKLFNSLSSIPRCLSLNSNDRRVT